MEPATSPLLIAVDGPAASGKGTIARALAAHFGLPYLDTGVLYRSVALSLVRFGSDFDNEFEAIRACSAIGQIDPTDPELRSEIVGSIASRISIYPGVRSALVERQRTFAQQDGGAVLDGRDIGTVIAPDAPAKLYVTAAPEVRAQRRLLELAAHGKSAHLDEVLADIRARDERDQGRDEAPLSQAPDAIRLDTSERDIDEAVAEAIRLVTEKVGKTA